MVVRLGFALATAIRPQVLLMDEWFLAGDATFMEKARVRLEDMVRGADILVLSTHVTEVVLNWCTRVIWLDQGRVRADGPGRGGAGSVSWPSGEPVCGAGDAAGGIKQGQDPALALLASRNARLSPRRAPRVRTRAGQRNP